jgi:hypothetical protein
VCPKGLLSLWYVRRKPCTSLASRLALSPNRPSFHLGLITSEYHQVLPKWFLSRWYVWRKLCTYLEPTLTLSWSGKKQYSTSPTSPKVHSMQTMHLSCIKISTIAKQTELSLEPLHLRVPLGVSNTISERIVRLPQTVHLPYTNTNTEFKRKEVWFYVTHIPYEFHQVRPKRFLSLHKPCIYLEWRLALHPKGQKRGSTWASLPSGTIRCIQNNIWAYGTSSTNYAPILHRH